MDINKLYDSNFEQSAIKQFDVKSLYTPEDITGQKQQNFNEYMGGVGGLGKSDYDTNISRRDIENLPKIRGERQPWYAQAGAFTNQAVVGEIIGGTIMSLGALADVPEMIGNAIDGSENEFSNYIYEAGKSISDWTRNVTPIYQTGERFGDSGWWFQNGVSVASAGSMLIPGMGVAKGVGALAKLGKLGTTATNMAQTGLGALSMRHAENFREASDVYKNIYNDGINAGLNEDKVKQAASNAAALDYNMNYANLAFDIIQMGAILKPLSGLTRNISGISGKLAIAADELLTTAKYTPATRFGKIMSRIKDPAKIGLSEWTEGIEEAINTVSQFESTRQGQIDLGLKSDDGSVFTERLGKYLGTQELQDAAMWGVIGGSVFGGIGEAIHGEKKNTQQRKIAELASRNERIRSYSSNINKVVSDNTIKPEDKTGIIDSIKDNMIKDLTFSAAKAGNIDILLDQVQDPKFIATLEESGFGSREELQQNIPNIVNKIQSYENIYTKNFNRFYESNLNQNVKNILIDKYSNLESKLDDNLNEINKINSSYNKLLVNDPWYKANSANPGVNEAIEMNSMQYAKIALEDALENSNDESNNSVIKEALNNLNKSISSFKPLNKPVDISAIDRRVIEYNAEKIVLSQYNNALSGKISEMVKPENINKEAKIVEKELDDFVNEIKTNKQSADIEESKAKVNEAKDRLTGQYSILGIDNESVPTMTEYEGRMSSGIDEYYNKENQLKDNDFYIFSKSIDSIGDEMFIDKYENLKSDIVDRVDNLLRYYNTENISSDEKESIGTMLKLEHKKLRLINDKFDSVNIEYKSPIELMEYSDTTKSLIDKELYNIKQERINEVLLSEIVESVDDNAREFVVRGKKYYNLYSFLSSQNGIPGAINIDNNGNIVSVTLSDENGKNVTFREEKIVDAISYVILVKQIELYESNNKINIDTPEVNNLIEDSSNVLNKKLYQLNNDLYEVSETIHYIDNELKQMIYEYKSIGYSILDAEKDLKYSELTSQKEKLINISNIIISEISNITNQSNEKESVKSIREGIERKNKKDVKRKIIKGKKSDINRLNRTVQQEIIKKDIITDKNLIQEQELARQEEMSIPMEEEFAQPSKMKPVGDAYEEKKQAIIDNTNAVLEAYKAANKGAIDPQVIKDVEDYAAQQLTKLDADFDVVKPVELIDNTGYNDGENTDVEETDIEVKESDELVLDSKRVSALALNYLAAQYEVYDKGNYKQTVDVSKTDPEKLTASEWSMLNPGSKVVVSLDRDFNGEVYEYSKDNDAVRRVKVDNKYSTVKKTFNEIYNDDKINAPIKVEYIVDNKVVFKAYLPTLDWLRSVNEYNEYENLANTETNPALDEIEKVAKIRQVITEGSLDSKYNFIVSKKGLGKLIQNIEDGKRVYKPISESLKNLINSKDFYSGNIKPFAIYNKGFKVGLNKEFSGNINLTEESLDKLSNKTGGVFIMVPSSKNGIFIPAPVKTPLLTSSIVKLVDESIMAYAYKNQNQFVKDVNKYYSHNIINSSNNLKEFLSEFIYFMDINEVNKTHGDKALRIGFDTKKSEILINTGNGKKPIKLALNTATSNPTEFNSRLELLKNVLPKARLSVKLSRLNSDNDFYEPILSDDGSISFNQTTYNNFLSANINTDLTELKTSNGKYVYTVQPVINIEQIKGEVVEPNKTKSDTDNISDLKSKLKSKIKGNSFIEDSKDLGRIVDEFSIGIGNLNTVEYSLRAVNILQSDRAKQIFAKGEKAKWDLNKILTELAIPKEQKELLLDLNITDREQLALELASKYGYTVEVNTAYNKAIYLDTEFNAAVPEWMNNSFLDQEQVPTKEPSKYYSNLTVPGGINYTENEISTPLITPSIKGHAQFSTDKGIGWFRSDETEKNQELISKKGREEFDEIVQKIYNGTATEEDYNRRDYLRDNILNYKTQSKTRRILEVQSDLFQKGRTANILVNTEKSFDEYLVSPEGYTDLTELEDAEDRKLFELRKELNNPQLTHKEALEYVRKNNKNIGTNQQNQFLQLLNKDNNWVTFFIKSIIQDSAKKGYEKILFPKGETAAKVEGHETIAERLKFINAQLDILKTKDGNRLIKDVLTQDNDFNITISADRNSIVNEAIAELEKEKVNIKSQGIEKLKPIEAFYEIKVGNILEKQFGKDNVKTITDEYGNQWREINVDVLDDIQLSIGVEQAENIKKYSLSFLVKDGDYVYTSNKQNEITKTIASNIYSQFIDNDSNGVKTSVTLAFMKAKESFSDLRDVVKEISELTKDEAELIINEDEFKFIGSYENSKVLVNEFNRILKDNVWKQFENQVITELKNLSIDVKRGSISDYSSVDVKIIQDSLNEDFVEGNDGIYEKSYDDFSSFQIDSKDTASWRVKIALSKIKDGKRNFLGLANYLPFDTVFDDLQEILWNTDGDINEYVKVLNEIALNNKSKQYINEVIKMLKSPETSIQLKNNFVSVMQRAFNNFQLVKWKKGVSGWTLNVISSNRNNVVSKITESWNENFKNSDYVKDVNGELFVDKNKSNKLLEELKALTNNQERKDFVIKLFNEIGIDIPDAAIKALTDDFTLTSKSYNIHGTFADQFSFTKSGAPNGMFSSIVDSMARTNTTEEEDVEFDSFELNNPFIGSDSESAIKVLANIASKYMQRTETNTHRNVDGKQIYDYSFYTPERLRIEKLNKDASLRNTLKNSVYTGFSSYLNKLDNGVKLVYDQIDGLSSMKGDGVTRGNMSSREQTLTTLAYFQRVNNANTVGYVGLTHSDKTFSPVVYFEKDNYSVVPSDLVDGKVTKESLTANVKSSIKLLVQAEQSRIKNIIDKKSKGLVNKNDIGSQYYYGAEYFYFFPSLNDAVKVDGDISLDRLDNTEMLTSLALDEVVDTINGTIDDFNNKGIVYYDEKTKRWTTSFNSQYVNKLGYSKKYSKSEVSELVAIAATDLEVNYMIHNANMMMLVHGDPALEFKEDVNTTLVEYQKRLAKDAAPGMLGHYNWATDKYSGSNKYNVIIANDIENGTLTDGYIKNIEAYSKLDRTDAQELTTLEEHLNVMIAYGRITEKDYTSVMDKIMQAKKDGSYNYELSENELKLIFGPVKPVQVYTNYDELTGVDQIYYIKSSSYPLIPQLTNGLDIDKVRVAMERDGIDRLAFKSATKIGYKKLAKLADNDGNILNDLNFNNNAIQLDRSGFLIQQDIPYEEGKHRIITISQMNKLLFEGTSDIEFNYNGKKYNGIELKKYKERIRSKLMDLSASELYDRMGIQVIDNEPVLKDFTKLLTSIKEEAEARGWSINDIESLSIDENGDLILPLSFNNSSTRIESLVLSMFTNTIIKQKINGKSLVQGTSSGFKNNVKTLDEIKDQSGIVFIKDKFDPKTGLKYLVPGDANNKTQRAQVLMPWKFEGEIKDYLDKDRYIDTNKFDKELLNLIGARIPNQSHSSQLATEIVGFLPKSMGDLIIVPGEITKQMGSDFDVDKLYTYIYNSTINKDGRLIKIPSDIVDINGEAIVEKYNDFVRKNYDVEPTIEQILGEEFIEGKGLPLRNFLVRAVLENVYIDIHNVVLTNNEVAKKCLTPLDADDLKETGGNAMTKIDEGNFLSSKRQLNDFIKQRAGKSGVGVYSRAVVGATVIQDYNLSLVKYDKDSNDLIPNYFTGFGYKSGDKTIPYKLHKLSGYGKSKFNDLTRSKVYNLIIQQSGAVDNAKTPVLDMNNLNMQTFNASIAISLLEDNSGNALNLEYNSYFLRQEIIKDYVKEIENMSDTLNEEYVTDRKEEVKNKLVRKYLNKAGLSEYNKSNKPFDPQALIVLLKKYGSNDVGYIRYQLEILNNFMILDSIGQELSDIFTAISTDSKGLGKSFWESSRRQEQIEDLSKVKMIIGANELLKDSENGKIANYVKEANTVMGQIFPYNKEFVKYTIEYLESLSGKNDRVDIEFRNKIWESIRMFIVSSNDLDTYSDRNSVFIGDNSLARRIEKVKESVKDNLFLNKLRTVKSTKVGDPDLLIFSASLAERTDEANVIKAFTDLLINPDENIRNLAEDLVKYSYSIGGLQKALEFSKYIPTAYMRTTNFTEIVNSIMNSSGFDTSRFIKQFIQHNPQYARRYNKANRDKFTIEYGSDMSLLSQVKIAGKNELIMPNFVSNYNDRSKKWDLYELTSVDGENYNYTKIGILGGKGKDYTSFNEYNYNKQDYDSLINSNNVVKKEIKSSNIVSEPKVSNEPVINNPVYTDVIASNYVSKLTGKKALEYTVSKFTEKRFNILGELLIKNSDVLGDNFSVSVDNSLKSNDAPVRGSSGSYGVKINPTAIRNFEGAIGRKLTNKAIEETIAHELLHSFTNELYNKYKTNPNSLNSSINESFRNIETLYKVAYSKLNEVEKGYVNAIIKGDVSSVAKSLKAQADIINKYQGFKSGKEFISEAISNTEFQKLLNGIEFQNNKSIFGRFKDLVIKIYNEFAKSLGFDVKQGSVLESTIIEVMELISSESSISEDTNIGNKIIDEFSLGMSVSDFMKTLNESERTKLREEINNGNIKFECK